LIPISIDIPSVLEVKIPSSQSFEEYILHFDSTLVGSPIYISRKSEEPSPHISFPPFSDFMSLDIQLLEPLSLHPKVTERSLRSLKTLSTISKFHPLYYQWLLLEEVVPAEVEEDLVQEGEEEA
jgi:hypothetical protein